MLLAAPQKTGRSKHRPYLNVFKKLSKGFTLIEILVVIAVVAVMMGLSVSLFNSAYHSRLKKEATRLMATVRYVYNESVSRKNVHRIVFDLTEQHYWVEEGLDTVSIESASGGGKKTSELSSLFRKKDKKKVGIKDEKEEKVEEAPPDFSPIGDEVFRKVALKDPVKLRDVYVVHQAGPVEEGKAYLYFFPNGQTEPAIIHFSDEHGETNFSVIVNPVTGRCRVEDRYVEQKELEE